MPIHQVLRLSRGAIIELDATEADEVKILANNMPIATELRSRSNRCCRDPQIDADLALWPHHCFVKWAPSIRSAMPETGPKRSWRNW